MTRPIALAAAALAIASPVAARGEPGGRPEAGRVALEPLRVRGIAPALAEAVEERLCAEIGRATGAEVVCPSDVAAAAAAARQDALLGRCASDECMRRVDAMRAAGRRVTGALEQGDDGPVLSLQVATAAGPGARVVEKLPKDVEALMKRIEGVARKLFPER